MPAPVFAADNPSDAVMAALFWHLSHISADSLMLKRIWERQDATTDRMAGLARISAGFREAAARIEAIARTEDPLLILQSLAPASVRQAAE